jgi:PleD family two-component response regulator
VLQSNTAKPTPSVLIVEDSLFDQRRIKRILNRNFGNADLHYANTLKAAQNILENNKFSLILLDNNLPDGRGADYVQTLAENPELASIPVIIISDWPTPFMWQKAQTAGVRYVLTKDEFHAGHVQSVLSNKENLQSTNIKH